MVGCRAGGRCDGTSCARWRIQQQLTSSGSLHLLPSLELRTEAVFLRSQLRRELFAEVLGLEQRTYFERRLLAGHRVRAAPDPFERFFHRLHLPQPESRDQFLGLGEGSINDGLLATCEVDALALR